MTAVDVLVGAIENLVDEIIDEKMKRLEDTYFAKAKQTQFTTSELATKWDCSVKHVKTVLKSGEVKATGKRSRENSYDGAEAQSAKDEYDSKVIYRQRLTNKIKQCKGGQ